MLETHNQTDDSSQTSVLVLILWDYWTECRALWHTAYHSLAPSMCIMTCSRDLIARMNQCVICRKWYCEALKDFLKKSFRPLSTSKEAFSVLNWQTRAVYYQSWLRCESGKNQGIKAWWASPSVSSCVNLVNHLPMSTE